MERELLAGMVIGVALCLFILKFKEMQRDVLWCKVYVDNHLNKEQADGMEKSSSGR